MPKLPAGSLNFDWPYSVLTGIGQQNAVSNTCETSLVSKDMSCCVTSYNARKMSLCCGTALLIIMKWITSWSVISRLNLEITTFLWAYLLITSSWKFPSVGRSDKYDRFSLPPKLMF